MQTPLKSSPLRIEHHALLSIHIEASPLDAPKEGISLRTRRSFTKLSDDGLKWLVDLTVGVGDPKGSNEQPYKGTVAMRGWFEIAHGYPEDKRKALIEVTAASILYGACREAIANLTARSVHGILSLPSVTFEPVRPSEDTPSKEKAKGAK
jgi:preprotein translocase subunit SecB